MIAPTPIVVASTARRIEIELRRAIVELEYPPGARLSEQDIAARYGVSRQPVREALIGLGKMRLVEIKPQRGTVVAKFSVRKMREARFVREAIETAVVRQACIALDPESRQAIDQALVAQAQAAAAGDHLAFQRHDEQFHIELANGTGNPMAWQTVLDLKAHTDRICQLTLKGPGAMVPLLEQHEAIIAAVDARDPERAAAAMAHHLTEILRAVPELEGAYPDLFE